MTGDLQGLIDRAAAVLRAEGAREIYVFGSAAKGELRTGSDVDLAVSGLPPQVFFRAMSKVSDVPGRQIDLIDLDEDSPFARYLRENGELLRVG
ncbi:MAG: nucleotidyltransferase domain-containing protein [Acidobacteriota bacterium]